jgi:hypothetical protein
MKSNNLTKSITLLLVFTFISCTATAHVIVSELENITGTQAAWFYIKLGFTHILPSGLDHILFVLSLFLSDPRIKPILKLSFAFTVAHSVTLALALYGVVNVSPSIIEPLIAFTIVVVATANILTRQKIKGRIGLIFLFGLVHGLGFASSLSSFGLPEKNYAISLVSFNFGVEIGQIAVIAAAFSLIGRSGENTFYRKGILVPASIMIILVAGYWTVQRLYAL